MIFQIRFFFIFCFCLLQGWSNLVVIKSYLSGSPEIIICEHENQDFEIRFYPNGTIASQAEIKIPDQCYGQLIYNGPFVSFASNGKIRNYGQLKDNILTGIFFYQEDGETMDCTFDQGVLNGDFCYTNHQYQLRDHCFFKEGKIHGLREITLEGEKIYEVPYVQGVINGHCIAKDKEITIEAYFEKGVLNNLDKTAAFTVNGPKKTLLRVQGFRQGLAHGVHRMYYNTESLLYQVIYQEGEKEGLEQLFDVQGNCIGGGKYTSGKAIGKHFVTHPSGNKAFEASYNDQGLLLDPIQYFYENENLQFKYFHQKGLLEGECIKYSLEGDPIFENNYHQGHLHGEVKYYQEKELIQKENYKLGKKEGWQERYHPDGKRKNLYLLANGQLDGTYLEWYPSGIKKISKQFRKELQEGIEEIWDEEGHLFSTRVFRGGILHGPLQIWYPNGTLKKEWTYVHGKKQGKCQTFFQEGQLQQEIHFVEDVAEHGSKIYHSNGKIFQTLTYHKGLPHGVWEVYSEEGNCLWRAQYEMGKKNGEEKLFFPNGMVAEVRMYENGQLTDQLRRWDQNGFLVEEASLDRGCLHGKRLLIDTNGELSVFFYEHGVIQGKYEKFFTSDVLTRRRKKQEGNYVNGVLQGRWIEYDQMGHKIISLNYKNGKKEGEVLMFYLDGQMKFKAFYKNDQLIESDSVFYKKDLQESQSY